MGPINRPETSVINYHYSLRNAPEERSSWPLIELSNDNVVLLYFIQNTTVYGRMIMCVSGVCVCVCVSGVCVRLVCVCASGVCVRLVFVCVWCVRVCVCVRVCLVWVSGVLVRACARACVWCVRARVCVCVCARARVCLVCVCVSDSYAFTFHTS